MRRRWSPAPSLAALAMVALVLQHTLSIPLDHGLRLGCLSGLELARQALTVVLFVVAIVLGAGLLPLLAVALVVNLVLIPPTAALVRGADLLRARVPPAPLGGAAAADRRPSRWRRRQTRSISSRPRSSPASWPAATRAGCSRRAFRVFIVIATRARACSCRRIAAGARASRARRPRAARAMRCSGRSRRR